MASAEEGIGRIDPFDHCLEGTPYRFVEEGMDLELHFLEQIDNR